MKRNRRRPTIIRNTVRYLKGQSAFYKAAAFGAKPEDRMKFLNRPGLAK